MCAAPFAASAQRVTIHEMGVERDVEIELRSTADIANARAAIRTLLTPADHGTFGIDVLLASSELMSNALEHTHGPATVRARRSATTLRVEVTDDGPDADLRAAMPRGTDHRGRGLAIVEAVARRWSVIRHPGGGKTVWFEIDPDV
jgi:hypothetical protein